MKKLLVLLLAVFIVYFPSTYKDVKAEENYTYAYINATELGPRTCPSTSCSRVYSDEGRIIWLYRPRTVEVLEYTGEWAKIRWNWYGFTYEGYILQKYLGNAQTVALDQNYANTLRSKGFPESYIESLTKMHMIHPNWNFEVSNTGISLADAVENEYSPVYKNLISTTNKNQLSTDGSAYSNGNYVQFEPGWYAPSKDTLRYYLDPRNFLDDNSVFMFEQLSSNSSVTEEDVQKILNGTFMQGTFNYNGQDMTYASAFINVGRQYNVNPVHLAARVLQEQGSSGSATAVMSSNDKTYYNYFNFNATGYTASEIISNALNYAINHGWDNPYKAIEDGAKGIANDYISNNQDTLYYQKFNIVGSSRFWHQYMANIQAPYVESYKSYSSYYNSGLVNTSFTFKIPVYTDMGTATQIAVKSNNNNLKSLSVSNCELSPNFDSAITEYTCSITDDVKTVKVNAEKANDKATVSGNGDITINGSQEIKVEVTAEDGSKKEYKVQINVITIPKEEVKPTSKQSPSDIVSSLGLNNNNNNISGFDLGKDIQDIAKDIKKKYPNAKIKVVDSNNKEITSGLIATGQKMTITSTSTITYNIVVKGDTNGDGKIEIGDYSKVKAYIQGKINVDGSYLMASDTNNDGKIEIGDYSKIKAYIQGKINNLK